MHDRAEDEPRLSIMRKAGQISQKALRLAGEAVEPGVSTWELDKIVRQYIESMGATPSFLHYNGFPASACISVNNVVIHGIYPPRAPPQAGRHRRHRRGRLLQGFHGDNAWTFPCGEVSEEARALLGGHRTRTVPRHRTGPPGQPPGGTTATRCRSMSKLAITRWYENSSATE